MHLSAHSIPDGSSGRRGSTAETYGSLLFTLVVFVCAASWISGCGSGEPASQVGKVVNGGPAGAVSPTTNPLVASYSITPTSGASIIIDFGTDLSYGRSTSPTTVPSGGGSATILVAGMRANTTYHMRARITLASGLTELNADQTFTTSALPDDLAALKITATTQPGMTPQPGIELMNPVSSGPQVPYALDLQGNIIWYYPWPDSSPLSQILGVKQMSNGHYLMSIGAQNSAAPLTGVPPGTFSAIREIDLVGNTVRQVTLEDLNTRLATAGYSLSLADFHHDVEVLPNGHWIVVANLLKLVNGSNVLGDALIDVDTDGNPVWAWNEFDYFDVNRRPMGFPDWTHTNAVVYSPSDGNLIVSMRHQSWVVKVRYTDGKGDGSVLWKLGYQGDFTLSNGTAPADWQYAQHYPSFVGTSTAGQFTMALMDNGNNRVFADGGTCGTTGEPACYSTVPIFAIDETAKTATVAWRRTLPSSMFNSFGGDAQVLANGNVEYDLCGLATGGEVDEVTQDTNQTLVWTLTTAGNQQYRALRTPSLYPGVQWQQ